MRTQSRYRSGREKGSSLGQVGATRMSDLRMRSSRLTVETVTVWAAFAITIACNAAFELMRLGGTTVAEVSSQVFAWFSPAPYAFFIWGIIYAAVAAWLVRFTYDAPRRSQLFSFEGLMFTASCVLNVLWLALFHYGQIAMSLVVIAALWVTVGTLYLTARRTASSAMEWVPFSVYAAWLTVATVVNAVNLATRLTDGGFALLNGASVVLLTAGVLAIAYAVRRVLEDPIFPLVALWAVVAVGVHVMAVSSILAVAVYVLAAVGALVIYVPFEKLHLRAATPGSV